MRAITTVNSNGNGNTVTRFAFAVAFALAFAAKHERNVLYCIYIKNSQQPLATVSF